MDNTSLTRCIENPNIDTIYPVFILEKDQISNNKYFSHNAVQFMCESLIDLDTQIRQYSRARLNIFKGDTIDVLDSILSKNDKIEYIYCNEDYSVYAKSRDKRIQELCLKHGVKMIMYEDYLLVGIHECLSKDRPYAVLAQFYKRFLKENVRKPEYPSNFKKLEKMPKTMSISDLSSIFNYNNMLAIRGGRTEAWKRLDFILPKLKTKYQSSRNTISDANGTTKMSAHLKFGTISVREMYWRCVSLFKTKDHPLIRELVFREFYTKIYGLRPELQRDVAYLNKLDKSIKWNTRPDYWKAWTTGTTGFPIVDAGMRQLISTGYTHNRARMIQGSFATRHLMMDWRDCARFYATQLVDIDPFVNIASWQWCAGVGVDAMYYRHPFNPILQAKKFDPECIYIKTWIPELANVPAKDILNWDDESIRSMYKNIDYPAPIVDLKETSKVLKLV